MRFEIKRKVVIWSVIAALVVLGLGFGLYFSYSASPNSTLKGAAVTNGLECSEIASDIFKQDGTVIDAAIAALFCEGVSMPQYMGLGGGFVATLYQKSKGIVQSLIARETAPLLATQDMFVNQTIEGGKTVGVPGELKGYWALHQKYGKLKWSDLLRPAIKLCRDGIRVSRSLATNLLNNKNTILTTKSMSEHFLNKETNDVYKEGELFKRPILGDTLEEIAANGVSAIYGGGKIGKQLAADIQGFNGIITEQDFAEYDVKWTKPTIMKLNSGSTLYSTPLPASGGVLAFILNVLDGFLPNDENIRWQRIVETFKHAYGLRTWLGDLEYVTGIDEIVNNMTNPEFASYIRTLIKDDKTFTDYKYYGANFSMVDDHGTANLAFIAPNGDAIAITSTVNGIFGSKRVSTSTGIVLNNQMDDFSTPNKVNAFGVAPSSANFIEPKKRPLSSMCPTLIIDGLGDVQLAIGGAGGTKITTSVALTIIRYLYLNEDLDTALQAKRLHHQLAPMTVQYEQGFSEDVRKFLAKVGHTLDDSSTATGFSALTAIASSNGEMVPVFDARRGGSTSVISL